MTIATPTYADEVRYDVRLTAPVTVPGLGIRLKPLPTHEMTGSVLNAIIREYGLDVVDSAEPR